MGNVDGIVGHYRSDPFSNGCHHSGAIPSRREGQFGAVALRAGAKVRVYRIDARCNKPYEYLTRLRLRNGDRFYMQNLGGPVAPNNYRSHRVLDTHQ